MKIKKLDGPRKSALGAGEQTIFVTCNETAADKVRSVQRACVARALGLEALVGQEVDGGKGPCAQRVRDG